MGECEIIMNKCESSNIFFLLTQIRVTETNVHSFKHFQLPETICTADKTKLEIVIISPVNGFGK